MGLIFLGIAFVLALFVFRVGSQAGWHWGQCLAGALVPIVFTFFLGILGVGIGFAFVVAVWKVN